MAEPKPRGVMAPLLRLVRRLREAGGKSLADILVISTVALIAAAAAVGLGRTTPVRFVENLTYDLRQQVGPPPIETPFVLIKIDDTAVNAMRDASPCKCLSPIYKPWLGDLLATLDRKEVKAVGVDYLLDIWESEAEFQDFQNRIKDTKAPIVAVVDPQLTAGVDYPVAPKLRYADARALVSSDFDDVIRRYDPKPSRYWSLAAEVGRAIGVKPPEKAFNIRYREPHPEARAENAGAIGPAYSAAFVDVLPDDFFKGRIAFIGRVTRSATVDADTPKEDMHATPLRFRAGHERGTPGVEVHMHALAQMAEGDRVRMPAWWMEAVIVLASALGGSMLGRSTQRWWVSVGIVLAAIVLGSVGAFALYAYSAFMAPMTTPAIGFAVGFFVLSRLAAAELQTQRAFYSSTLERYLAPQVIDRMVEGQEEVKIGAEEREITVMISDLENFSNLVASLDLETFEGVINEYFDGVIDILWKHEAMIDKMTGDGIIAIFGAPVPTTDHADRAIACAREIDAFGLDIRSRMIERGIKFGYTRMGLSSGIGLVGNFGGERRFNYTAYGEVVVIAARLEAANKTFGTRILFSGDTLRLAKIDVPIRPVGEIDLKGVPLPIPAYTTQAAEDTDG